MPKVSKVSRGTIQSKFYAKTNQEWQSWLENNHNTVKEIWLMFYRDHTKRQNIGYKDSVNIAGRFDWKQTLMKRIDDDSFARKFVPIPPDQLKEEDDTEKADIPT
jgi:uncharacterized protein YdeI (YjbR/CyaY-like superfamily)